MKDFMIINDVQQKLNPKIFGGGPWLHLATVKTPPRMLSTTFCPEKEYLCVKDLSNNKIYIEELDLNYPSLLKKIKDDSLFNDLAEFLTLKGILGIALNKEFKIAKKI